MLKTGYFVISMVTEYGVIKATEHPQKRTVQLTLRAHSVAQQNGTDKAYLKSSYLLKELGNPRLICVHMIGQ